MGATTQRMIAAALALGLSGCGGKGGVDTEALERAFQADLATLQAISCERPVLREDGPMSDPAKVGVAISMPMFGDYARKHAVMVGQLHALRVELALGARTRRTKARPTPADASSPELAPLLEGKLLGAPLTLVAGDADQLRIESVGALGGSSRTEPFVLSRVGCKDGALTAP